MKSSNAAKINHAVWVLAGLMLGGFFGKAGTSLAAEHTWAQKVDMPTARYIHSASVVDGKIYVIGGSTSEPNPVAVWPVEVYDPIADSWAQGAHIPTGRAGHSTSVVDGKVYVVGGFDGSGVLHSAVLEYNPATD
ncbi:MAG: Kelch repeat-containing protein, partial [Planctomycetota bacterium]